MKYNPKELQSVVKYLKEKHKLLNDISFFRGILYGIKKSQNSEQEMFETKKITEEKLAKVYADYDELKKTVKPNLKKYYRQMTFAHSEVDGNKIILDNRKKECYDEPVLTTKGD